MKQLMIIVAVLAVIGYFWMQRSTAPDPATVQHAAVTQMALRDEAKAKQAVAIASTDQTAEFEKQTEGQ